MTAGALTLVTGASRGIGRAVALDLAASGRSVVGIGRDAHALVRLVAEGGERVQALDMDLSADDGVERVVEAAQRLGEPVELVHCAGVVHYQKVGAIEPVALREQLILNLEVPLLLGQALGLRMAEGRGGAMVFISSTLAERAAPETTAYAASKAGLEAALRGLALELAPRGVRVNGVAPGVVDTDMVRAPRGDGLDPDVRLEQLRRLHPLGRLGTPADVVSAVRYLLEAPWVTGSVLRVDGGLALG